jgi:Zn-dependent M28 family amino/carboxypeptidase
MTAMEAARILCATHAKPKRTIRFILWSGEEQGIYGSTEYVKQHKDELDKISAVLVDDGGGNYQGGYVILPQMKPMMEQAIQKSLQAFPDMPQVLRIASGTKMPRGGGSDHAPFNAVGVPGFFTIETGKLNYTFVHHTQNDRYETCIPEYLVQSGTNHALVSYNLACADTLLPREPKPAQ